MNLDWLENIASGWQMRLSQGRLPHAVILLGPPGTGKRATAAWMAAQRLNPDPAEPLPEHPFQPPEHADLHWLAPPEGKRSIGVDQIRNLVAEFSLTSYQGGGKVAVIDPANAMTASAANSLLKTLEEPPGDALLILIADRVGHLPATIFSRCQRISFNCPPIAESLAWLERRQAGANWPDALSAAGGAPLGAIGALQQLADTDSMAKEFAAVAERKTTPLAVAARWATYEPEFVLNWLCGEVQHYIRRLSGTPVAVSGSRVSESVLCRIDRRNLFCYLDIINRLRAQAAGSFNVQLTFESLLIDWAQSLSGVSGPGNSDSAKLSFANR